MTHLEEKIYYVPFPLRILDAYFDQGVLFSEFDKIQQDVRLHNFIKVDQEFAKYFYHVADFVTDFAMLCK